MNVLARGHYISISIHNFHYVLLFSTSLGELEATVGDESIICVFKDWISKPMGLRTEPDDPGESPR